MRNISLFRKSLLLLLAMSVLSGACAPTAPLIQDHPISPRFSNEFAELSSRASSGNAEAELRLGKLYAEGIFTAKDPSRAVFWFKRAAAAGLPEAFHNLAIAYEYGEGVEKDLSEAAAWYEKAAALGFIYSQYNLGALYASNALPAFNNEKAYEWLLISQKLAREVPDPNPLDKYVLQDPLGYLPRVRERLNMRQQGDIERKVQGWRIGASRE